MTEEAAGIIYVVIDKTEPERVRYVGLTTRKLNHRESGHWTTARTGTLPINRFLRKRVGRRGDVKFIEVDRSPTFEELNELEKEWISLFREVGEADLNITDGGGGTKGRKMPSEEKQAKRESMIGRFRGDKYQGVVKLTWEKVADIRAGALESWRPHREIAREYGVSQTIISQVIRGTSWVDETYDPSKVKERPPETHANNRKTTRDIVDEIRGIRMREWVTEQELAKRYGMSRSNIQNILSNARWSDPKFDPKKMVRAGGDGIGSKITEEDVIDIRKRYKAGEKQRTIGDSYGIGQVQVSRIVRGVRWGHVEEGL